MEELPTKQNISRFPWQDLQYVKENNSMCRDIEIPEIPELWKTAWNIHLSMIPSELLTDLWYFQLFKGGLAGLLCLNLPLRWWETSIQIVSQKLVAAQLHYLVADHYASTGDPKKKISSSLFKVSFLQGIHQIMSRIVKMFAACFHSS